ncbi:MAG: IPT/TIG domain-containing protein [Alphaproteobacteria bacterium]|nr:IPT/TIG domain-containing protein [Alphaproteobacteria bacterium]
MKALRTLLLLLTACAPPFEAEKVSLFDSAFQTVDVSSIDPEDLISTEGGYPVCVRGRGFDAAEIESVQVNGEDCLAWEAHDDRTLGCQVPPAAAGEGTLTVTKLDGSADSGTFLYTQVDAEVVSVGCCGMHPTEGGGLVSGEVDYDLARLYVFVEGITDQGRSAADQLIVQVGIGDKPSRPDFGCWDWTPANLDSSWTEQSGELRFIGPLVAPDVESRTSFDFAFRVSADQGRTWAYCDQLNGSSTAFDGSCQAAGGGNLDGYDEVDGGFFFVDPAR